MLIKKIGRAKFGATFCSRYPLPKANFFGDKLPNLILEFCTFSEIKAAIDIYLPFSEEKVPNSKENSQDGMSTKIKMLSASGLPLTYCEYISSSIT